MTVKCCNQNDDKHEAINNQNSAKGSALFFSQYINGAIGIATTRHRYICLDDCGHEYATLDGNFKHSGFLRTVDLERVHETHP